MAKFRAQNDSPFEIGVSMMAKYLAPTLSVDMAMM
jgi:hypothetical protein